MNEYFLCMECNHCVSPWESSWEFIDEHEECPMCNSNDIEHFGPYSEDEEDKEYWFDGDI